MYAFTFTIPLDALQQRTEQFLMPSKKDLSEANFSGFLLRIKLSSRKIIGTRTREDGSGCLESFTEEMGGQSCTGRCPTVQSFSCRYDTALTSVAHSFMIKFLQLYWFPHVVTHEVSHPTRKTF